MKIALPIINCSMYKSSPLPQEEDSKQFSASLQDKLEVYSKFLGAKKFCASDEVTFADFHMYEVLDILKVMYYRRSFLIAASTMFSSFIIWIFLQRHFN